MWFRVLCSNELLKFGLPEAKYREDVDIIYDGSNEDKYTSSILKYKVILAIYLVSKNHYIG